MSLLLVIGTLFIVASAASVALGFAGHRSNSNSVKAGDILTFTSIAAVILGLFTFIIWVSSQADTYNPVELNLA